MTEPKRDRAREMYDKHGRKTGGSPMNGVMILKALRDMEQSTLKRAVEIGVYTHDVDPEGAYVRGIKAKTEAIRAMLEETGG